MRFLPDKSGQAVARAFPTFVGIEMTINPRYNNIGAGK